MKKLAIVVWKLPAASIPLHTQPLQNSEVYATNYSGGLIL